LVDADLRKPALHRIFGLPSQAGLTNVLIGDKTVEDAMASTEIEGLKVISSGPLPPDAAQVLRSRRMKEVIEDLKNRADLIIIDSPPLLSVTDPMLLTPLVDAVLLVVDAHRTSRDTLRRGVEVLAQASPQIAGTVLNKIPANGGSLYYYHHYYYNSDGNERQRNRMAKLVSKVLHRGRSGTGKGKS
jgi:capsular exopolysaccharide synthesis family protein